MPKKRQSELPLPDLAADTAAEPASEAPESGAASPQSVSFERALQRLGEIVERLESDELALDESLTLFEQGIRLARSSQSELDRAEKRVQELLNYDEDGNPVLRDLDEK